MLLQREFRAWGMTNHILQMDITRAAFSTWTELPESTHFHRNVQVLLNRVLQQRRLALL